MANEKFGSTTVEQTGAGSVGVDEEDVFSGAPTQRAAPRPTPRTAKAQARAGALSPSESQHAFGEVAGDAVAAVPYTGVETQPETVEALHEEVFSVGPAEAGEEFIEATPEQLLAAAESGEESALSDLRGIEGYEETEAGEEAGAVAVQGPILDAGEAGEEADQEFLPILAALAPTLISAIGPTVAKGVMSKLSPRAKRAVKRIPAPVKAAATAAGKAALTTASGKNNLLGLIAKLLQQAQAKESFETGMEAVDETFIEEAARAMEVIIGKDDRVQIKATTNIPWRRVCALRITFPSGSTYRGTGFLIGPRAVATAGHCVYLHDQGGWARKVEVIPGCNGTSRPYGQVESTSFRSVAGWVTGKKPESDYGCIVLPPGSFGGRNLGSFGCANFDAAKLVAQPAVLGGYPGDKPFAELWGMSRIIKTVSAKTLVYDIDTVGGQSGAPVYIKRAGQRYVVGIHNYGAATGNSATRVTEPVYQRLLAWSKL
jgi:V8-like Glu-specific endopeptidase